MEVKDNHSCLVSVVIPMYNAADFIGKTIESVLNQSHSNLEIIVVDNCSTDNSIEIVNGFKDKRILLHKNEKNLGFSGNVNKGISLAKGEYIKFLCADDTLKPNCIEELLQIAKNGNDVVYCNCDYIDKDGNIIIDKPGEKNDFSIPRGSKELIDLFTGKKNLFCCISFLLLKNGFKSRFEDIDNSSYNSDFVFMFDLIDEFGHIYYTSKKLANLRHHSAQGTYKSHGNEIFRLPLLFRKKIIEHNRLSLSKRQVFAYRFIIFKNGVNAFARYQHKIPNSVFKYTIKEFGFHYYLLLFGLYFPFVYLPKKLLLMFLSFFKRKKYNKR